MNAPKQRTSWFDYDTAFSRNKGWLTEEEFHKVRHFRVAIAGVGGVGGVHLITLVRMGFTKFHIADPDFFEIQNFNRQYGAKISTLQKNKCQAMKDEALAINPDLEIQTFETGIDDSNLHLFFKGVDIYVDGLDVFEMKMRSQVFKMCQAIRIPCVTSAPIGFGASIMIFDHQSMTFEKYFGLSKANSLEQTVRFILGMGPSLVHLPSLVDRKYSNLLQKRTSSTPAGCHIASGFVATEVVKILLQRGPIKKAPWIYHFDAYSQTCKKNYLWLGHRNPIFKIKLLIMLHMLKKMGQ